MVSRPSRFGNEEEDVLAGLNIGKTGAAAVAANNNLATIATETQAVIPVTPANSPVTVTAFNPPATLAPSGSLGSPPHKPKEGLSEEKNRGGRPSRDPYERFHVSVATILKDYADTRWRSYVLRTGKLASNRNEYVEDLIAREREQTLTLDAHRR